MARLYILEAVFSIHTKMKLWAAHWTGVSGEVSVSCRHATPVANAQWKPLTIR